MSKRHRSKFYILHGYIYYAQFSELTKYYLQLFSKYLLIFLPLSTTSLHQKWNGSRLVSAEIEYTNCLYNLLNNLRLSILGNEKILRKPLNWHYVKSVQIRSFFWSECGKIRTRKNSVLGHISRCLSAA